MAWNRNENGASVKLPKAAGKSAGLLKWVGIGVAVVGVIVGIGYGLSLLKSGGGSGGGKPGGSGLIPTQNPDLRSNKVEKVEAPEPEKPAVVTNFNEQGVWYDDKGRPHYKPARVIAVGSNTIINGKRYEPPKPIFHHTSENELDRVLSASPGERIIGETNWRQFEKDLPDAMVDPIRIEPDDTPDIVERKEAVIAAKKELAAAMGQGESPTAILKEAQKDLNDLASLYEGLNSELYELRSSGELTEEEYNDYVAAANKMLESKNIFTKRFRTPAEIREKAEAANQRRLEREQQEKLQQYKH